MPTESHLWWFLLIGYFATVAIELPVLLVGLSSRFSFRQRLVIGFSLTACTYPMVVLVLPNLVWEPYGRGMYLLVAEIFAPAAECLIFWLVFEKPPFSFSRSTIRDFAAITVANLASFLLGELWYAFG